MLFSGDEVVLRRLEKLKRRAAALESAVEQLMAEMELDKNTSGMMEDKKKVLVKDRMKSLFDANIRFKNLTRNYKRWKELPIRAEQNYYCGEHDLDEEFEPCSLVAVAHEPRTLPLHPLPHSKMLHHISWRVGWAQPLPRRHFLDGQFSDADLNTEAWACSSPTCKNIFFPRRALGDLGKEGFKCWSCGLKAFSVNETEEDEIFREAKGMQDNEREITSSVDEGQEVNILVHSDSRGEETTCILTEVPDLEKPRQDLKEAMPSPSDTSSVTVITNIKAKPPKIVKVKSHAGKCDVSSSTARQKGAVGNNGKKVSKPQDQMKPFSTRPVCNCPHPYSTSLNSRGQCPLHPTSHGGVPEHILKSSASEVSSRKVKPRGHSGNSSAQLSPFFPGCTCPDFHSKSKEDATTCQVHPNLHHLRLPADVTSNHRRKRLDFNI